MNIHQFYLRKGIGFIGILIILISAVGVMSLRESKIQPIVENTEPKYQDALFTIEGRKVQLETKSTQQNNDSNSRSNVSIQYFGNELVMDLDGDGEDDDIAFIVTQNRGESGTFFYAVAALDTNEGFKGTDGYFLGDRVAPQSTTISPNPRHKNVVVFNYADRAKGETVTTSPSIGKSVYLKVSLEDMRWGIVEPDFEGESR